VSDWQQMGVSNLAGQVRELTSTLQAVVGELPELAEALARTDADVDRLVAERAETGAAIARHDQELRELMATVKRLATQVTWIERHIRSSGTALTANLDHVEPELTALAATSEAGHRASEGLLAPFVRSALADTVGSFTDAVARHLAAARSVLDACERLVDTEPDGSAHRQARAEYSAARSAWHRAQVRVDTLAQDAATARERLTTDDEERRRAGATVAAGERAEMELLTRLRTKLAAAVGQGALLPAWLTGPLGPMPPSGRAQRWMDVAAGLIAYRITYAVDDPEDALGDLPDDALGYRRRWHEDLGQGMRDLRR
jgi:hypothetical protein